MATYYVSGSEKDIFEFWIGLLWCWLAFRSDVHCQCFT